jgi:outer membrane protein assembly factor BamA
MALSNLEVVCAATPGLVENNKTNNAAIDSGKKNVIKSIKFENNRKYKDKDLLKKLDFEVGDYIDPILAESSRRTIIEFYRSKGYPLAEVMLNRKKLPEGHIIYTVVKGLRFRIKSVRFKDNKAIKTGDLKNTIKDTKTSDWLLWPVYYTEEKIAADGKAANFLLR